jgi:hypothetical protein
MGSLSGVNTQIGETKMYSLAECFQYLDHLRESGVTNMYGAAPYLEEEFAISSRSARAILGKWMKSFSEDETAEERAEKVE